ncbi:hypothetical protein K493DRAFT_315020 [Basidiobolus meristosporus CBS 931.73]|uniref:Uncharacterized protein n=1 Tax=Basidiobolus meristosporus CBS 931.73 TaxID=1314790 RepID=A0A1Y1YBX9_9FUNG|nr:hypothetical protein K493DRAFT_315020 [Basidiobolus meristosporus CBS 931.73]|eukprot:ORX95443.1 hypothetical protein K493DRAFT_315020 [Basidiobolus meristosporus CBS 931.73]
MYPEVPSVPLRMILTRKHILYLAVMHSIGAGILDAGINFGIATAMYKTSDNPVQLWSLKNNTIAGDAGVTIIIQTILTWVLDTLATNGDLKRGIITPIRGYHPKNSVFRWFLDVEGHRNTKFLTRLIHDCLRGFIYCFPIFVVFWPIGVGIMAGFTFNHWPTPQIFKAVYAGLMGIFTTPIITFIVLVRAGIIESMDGTEPKPEENTNEA